MLFERGSFRPEDTPDVAVALTALAPGLVAFSLVNILGRAFYALGDTRTPMKISVFCLALNTLLTFPLVWAFQQAGMGMANTTTGILNVTLLVIALRKKLKTLEMAPVRNRLLAIAGAALAAGVIAIAVRVSWTRALGHQTLLLRLGEVFVPCAAAAVAYFGIALAMRIPFARDILAVLRRKAAR